MSQNRLLPRGFDLIRFSPLLGRYRTLPHSQELRSAANERRVYEGSSDGGGSRVDGLSDLRYSVVQKEEAPLYLRILVDI